MKKVFKFFLFLIIIFSLGLNIILLYERKKEVQTECAVVPDDTINKKEVKLTKNLFSKLFKAYLVESEYASADNMALFEIEKITEVGKFKSNDKKLYYVDVKYSCIEGTDCLKTVGKVSTDESYISTTTFVVAANTVDESTIVFEILDYGIEKSEDFIKTKEIELK